MLKIIYVIGVDGGGTKTVAALADARGKIIKKMSTGSSNPNKVGFDTAVFRLGKLLNAIIRSVSQEKIGGVYLALAAALERDFQKRKQIKNAILSRFPILKPLAAKIKIEGDQKAAFRSGTDEKDGVVLIAGTGSIAMGWFTPPRSGEAGWGKEAIAGGWDYILGDQGSAFWVGQEVLRIICKELDGRGPKTRFLTKMVLSHWRIKNGSTSSPRRERDLFQKIYGENTVETVASLAALADKAAQKGDKIARDILVRAGKELALAALTVIQKLYFQQERFPLVLIGGMFQSRIVEKMVRKEIKAVAPRSKFIRPAKEPVMGAVKLALETLRT